MRSMIIGILIILLMTSVVLARVGGGDVVFTPKKGKGITFSHDFHVKDVDLSCQKCHPGLYITKEKDKPVTMAEMYQGKSCGACHNGKDAFTAKGNCSKCHR